MVDSRIKRLAVISIHRRRALNIDLDKIVDGLLESILTVELFLYKMYLIAVTKVVFSC